MRILNRIINYYQVMLYGLFILPNKIKYRLLSDCLRISGKPKYIQPALLSGKGRIIFGKNVTLGVKSSPYIYSNYGYIEARSKTTTIEIRDNVWINNNFTIVGEGEGIVISDDTIIGFNVEIVDSDFHDLHPDKRMCGFAQTAKVEIGRNVFIGNNVKILKGVTIGNNCVIANGSIVTKSIPMNSIAGGVPARIIKVFMES